MDKANKALKMANKACVLAKRAKLLLNNHKKYIVLVNVDNLWKNPTFITMIFHVVARDTQIASPAVTEDASYTDITNIDDDPSVTFLFDKYTAEKYADKLNEAGTNMATVMSLSNFKRKYYHYLS